MLMHSIKRDNLQARIIDDMVTNKLEKITDKINKLDPKLEKEFGFTYKEHGVEDIPSMCLNLNSDWGKGW